MITDNVTQGLRDQLAAVFDHVEVVNLLNSEDTVNLALLNRPDLGVTFTKLHCWRLTQYSKCVFLDADCLVLSNVDDLFEREELSAAPDVGWPDCFNSGVFVFVPSLETYQSLVEFALSRGSFDGGDQGLLNLYFSNWATQDIARHLPFIYNCVSTTFYSYLPAFKQFGENVKIVHFIGAVKPWHYSFNVSTGKVEGVEPTMGVFLQHWWNLFMKDIHTQLSPELMSFIGGLQGQADSRQPESFSPEELSDARRQYKWESGSIDYLGIDAFSNIKKRLDEVLTTKPSQTQPMGGSEPVTKKIPTIQVVKEKEKTPPKSALKKK
jgi:glycogenin glucosyltransferase